MKKKVDFLIRYEHKVRELESIMLLKLELERRGYSVDFVANYDYKDKRRFDPKVIVSPAIYNNGQLMTDLSRYGLKKKIANLLWEQLIGIAEEESPVGAHNVYGTGQKVVTFCWGDNSKRRLVAAGMLERNAKVVGLINTDLLRKPFSGALQTKEQLADQYGIALNTRWNLFISSFAYCELDELQKDLIMKMYGEKYFNEFTQISVESRNAVLTWFRKLMVKYPNDVIIYRPHPDEIAKSQELKDMSSKFPNFHVVADLSLKQWCNAADKIYNWYSTGVVDAFVLDKPIRILRPVYISDEYDYRIFYTADHIKTYEDFLNDYPSLDEKKVMDSHMMADYYYTPERFVYQEVCDVLEEMLKTDKYDIHYTTEEKRKFIKSYWKASLIRNISFIKPILRRLHLFNEKFASLDAVHKVLDDGYEKNVATETELTELHEKLKPFVYGQQV